MCGRYTSRWVVPRFNPWRDCGSCEWPELETLESVDCWLGVYVLKKKFLVKSSFVIEDPTQRTSIKRWWSTHAHDCWCHWRFIHDWRTGEFEQHRISIDFTVSMWTVGSQTCLKFPVRFVTSVPEWMKLTRWGTFVTIWMWPMSWTGLWNPVSHLERLIRWKDNIKLALRVPAIESTDQQAAWTNTWCPIKAMGAANPWLGAC